MSVFTDGATAIRAVEMVGSVGVSVSSVEWLTNARHLRDDALLSWPISQLRHRGLASALVAPLLDPMFRYPAFLWVVAIRLAAALLLIAGASDGSLRAFLTIVVAVTTVAIALRSPFGLDGADQMAMFIFATLALVRLLPRPVVEVAFIWTLTLQSCLAYFTAGIAKLVSPIWRSGAAIAGISSTRMYGSEAAARLVHGRPGLGFVLAWSVILMECLFPLALIAPLPIALVILASGAVFHIISGVVMGLNTFIWSFVATYPAILWCHAQLHGA